MNRQISRIPTYILVLLTIMMSVACAASPTSAPAADSASEPLHSEADSYEGMSDSGEIEMGESASDDGEAYAEPMSSDEAYGEASARTDEALQTAGLQNRKIIREATIQLEAEEVTTALNQATALSVRVGGYTMGSTSWQEAGDRQYASFSFAVPVERFEEALEQTRRLGKVTSENVTSQDVTAQFVDVEARIGNLEATAERVRGFLVEATDLEYILQVNRELSRIEGDLESLKGQRNVLKQRTSFSRIYLDFTPPPIVPTTTEVLETATVWSPVGTFNSALAVLLNVLKSGADVAIWLVVIGLPVALIGGLIWIVIRKVLGSRVLGSRVRGTMQTNSEVGA